MDIISFARLDLKVQKFFIRLYYFLNWFGHFLNVTFLVILRRKRFHHDKFLDAIYYSGVRLFWPLLFISVFTSAALTEGICALLNQYNVQKDIMKWMEFLMLNSFIPFMLAIMLGFHAGFHVIHYHVQGDNRSLEDFISEKLFPRICGLLASAFALYFYVLFSVFIASFIVYASYEELSFADTIFILANEVQDGDIFFSFMVSMLMVLAVSAVVGFYHYLLAKGIIGLRTSVSNIVTRSILWVIIINSLVMVGIFAG